MKVNPVYYFLRTTILLVVIIVFGKCNTESASIPVVSLMPSDEEGEVRLSDIFDSINIIHLETSENSLLSSITQVAFTNEKIIVNDRRAGLKVFDMEGNYLNNIGSFGSGPGEFGRGGRIYVSEKQNAVYVNNNSKRILMKYDIEGEFLAAIPIPEHYGSIYINEESEITLVSTLAQVFTKGYFDLLKLSSAGDTLMLLTNNDLISRSMPFVVSVVATHSFELDSIIYIKRAFNDTLYMISGAAIVPIAILDHGGNGLGFHDLYTKKVSEYNGYLVINDLLIVRNKLLVNYNYKGSQYWLRYCFSDGQSTFENVGASEMGSLPITDVFYGINNDLFPNLGNWEISLSNGIYYSILDWGSTVSRIGEENSKSLFSDENDNPVILIYK